MDQSATEPKHSKYTKMLNKYNKLELHNIAPMLLIISKQSKFSAKYPVYKLLKAISKNFLLNEIQCIFLTYLIQQTDWNIRENILYRNSENMKDIINSSIQTQQYKSLVLYITACVFTVKYYLNEVNQQLYEQAKNICENFKLIFEGWVKKHSTIIAKINLKTLNRVYKVMFICTRDNTLNFNMMVDAILQISPAYSSDKQKPFNKEPITKPSDFNPKLDGGKLKPGVLTHKQYIEQSRGANNSIEQSGRFDLSLIRKQSDRRFTNLPNPIIKDEDDQYQQELLFHRNDMNVDRSELKNSNKRHQMTKLSLQSRIPQTKIQQFELDD